MSIDIDTTGGVILPSEIGGGAASMILSFASGSIKHVETTAVSYASLAHFIYGGSDVIGGIINFNINAWITQAGNGSIRLYDLTNNLVIAEITDITSGLENNIRSFGTISNLPTGPAVIEIQAYKTTGPNAGRIRIASLEIQYE